MKMLLRYWVTSLLARAKPAVPLSADIRRLAIEYKDKLLAGLPKRTGPGEKTSLKRIKLTEEQKEALRKKLRDRE